ncbi:hypothetical protein AKJ42_01775 [candidate division MSBL1 archaeon SCGC-AAA261C02]|uniref:Uncharacterized protein n=1 Tax=candidate division MSBL1 archaeon SCGC-AAA261C02 TaxID=1698272 RepID=A0A133V0V2_9EURY|nr:hypothetical protein AKJ42_01775 [candidate division MSBL1 archaeon SCGC-AAA261C02]
MDEKESYEVFLDEGIKAVYIRDNVDSHNLPAAFTVRKGGLKGNSRTFKRARELARSAKDFSEALDLWEDAGIRYHYYCRTD